MSARRSSLLRALGLLGLLAILASVCWLAAGAAARPSLYVPARRGGWPGWLAGPLQGLHLSIDPSSFQTLTLIMAAGYVAVLLAARVLPGRALAATILAAHVVLVLGPPLISQDVLGYLSFARLGALHGLDPYTHVAAQAPTDATYAFIGWPYQHSPYGPLFTLLSYAFVPLGVAGGLWALKVLAAAASLGAVALVAKAAADMGRSPRAAAAFVGLNPVLLELAVGGAHNDTLVLALLAAALALTANALRPRFGGAAAALAGAVAVKASAGLVLPFLVLAPRGARARMRVLLATLASLAVVVAVGTIGFGSHVLGFLSALHEQQQLVAVHSVPAETARLFGLNGVPGWWRNIYLGAFAAVLLGALWRTARGADWRTSAGWATLALLLSTAWLLPWYAIWPLPLAAVSASRRLRAAVLVFCAYALLIHLPLAKPLLSPPQHSSAPQHLKTAELQNLKHVHEVHARRRHQQP
ncbi:MAG TPA: glycosyltransferase 87 family protein [Solirubrobacteraceae bacterium]|jgi:alpha-1,6-mannosyltransferase